MPWMPEKGNETQRALLRAVLIFGGIVDFALAVFFFGWGEKLFQIEADIALILAGGMAFAGVTIIVLALTVFGRKRGGRAVGESNEGPVVRR